MAERCDESFELIVYFYPCAAWKTQKVACQACLHHVYSVYVIDPPLWMCFGIRASIILMISGDPTVHLFISVSISLALITCLQVGSKDRRLCKLYRMVSRPYDVSVDTGDLVSIGVAVCSSRESVVVQVAACRSRHLLLRSGC